jgi:hypothetical protein
MISEEIFAVFIVLVLMRLLFPELFRPAPASGVVSGSLSYSNAPVAGATVTLYTPDMQTEVAIATADSNGAYTLPEVAAGNYHVTAVLRNADGTWLQADKDITVDAPTVTVDLTMDRTTASYRHHASLTTKSLKNDSLFRGLSHDAKTVSC